MTSTTDDPFVSWLLEVRHQPAVRSALRRAELPTLEDHAIPYLARWVGPDWRKDPVFLIAAAAATHHRLRHTEGQPLGKAAAHLDPTRATDSGPGSRLLTSQRQTLRNAHRLFNGVLAMIDEAGYGIDWVQLSTTYHLWDHPNLDVRRRARRRLLHDYFGTTDPSDERNEN